MEKITFSKLYEAVKERHLVMSFGRMNPPTVGHGKLIDKMHEVAKKNNADHLLVLSHSQDSKKNPLSPEEKLIHAKRFFPKTNIKTADKSAPSYIHHLANAHKAGYKHITMVVGSDRVPEFEKVINKYNGHFDEKGNGYHFKSVNVVSAGHRDPDAPGVEGMSASKMRAHAQQGNYSEFKKGVPNHVSDTHTKQLYNTIRRSMKIHEIAERDLYVRGKIYLIDETVVDVETGEHGIIGYRGPNFVALKLDSGITVKRWLPLIETVSDLPNVLPLENIKAFSEFTPVIPELTFHYVDKNQILEDIKMLRWDDIQELYDEDELTEGKKKDLKKLSKRIKGLKKSSSKEEIKRKAQAKALSILVNKITRGKFGTKFKLEEHLKLQEELDKYKDLQSHMVARLIPIMREIENTRLDGE